MARESHESVVGSSSINFRSCFWLLARGSQHRVRLRSPAAAPHHVVLASGSEAVGGAATCAADMGCAEAVRKGCGNAKAFGQAAAAPPATPSDL